MRSILGLIVLSGALTQNVWARISHTNEQTADSSGSPKTEPFIDFSSGMGHMPDGTRFTLRVYEATDGTKADIRYATFSSPDLANSQLHRWIKLAGKPPKVEKKRDPSGKVIGERVLMFFEDKERQHVTKIIWTDGLDYYEIGSLSRSTALNLEKWTLQR